MLFYPSTQFQVLQLGLFSSFLSYFSRAIRIYPKKVGAISFAGFSIFSAVPLGFARSKSALFRLWADAFSPVPIGLAQKKFSVISFAS